MNSQLFHCIQFNVETIMLEMLPKCPKKSYEQSFCCSTSTNKTKSSFEIHNLKKHGMKKYPVEKHSETSGTRVPKRPRGECPGCGQTNVPRNLITRSRFIRWGFGFLAASFILDAGDKRLQSFGQ